MLNNSALETILKAICKHLLVRKFGVILVSYMYLKATTRRVPSGSFIYQTRKNDCVFVTYLSSIVEHTGIVVLMLTVFQMEQKSKIYGTLSVHCLNMWFTIQGICEKFLGTAQL